MSFKQCVFFDGGKKFNLETSNHDSFFKIEKDGLGNWIVSAKLCLSVEEGKNAIDDFESLNIAETEIPKMPNILFLNAKDAENNFLKIEPKAGNFIIVYGKDEESEIIIKMAIGGAGKTQNAKTQNAKTQNAAVN